jgi:hypothetical protein
VPVRKNAFLFNWAVGLQVARYEAILSGNASRNDANESPIQSEMVNT